VSAKSGEVHLYLSPSSGVVISQIPSTWRLIAMWLGWMPSNGLFELSICPYQRSQTDLITILCSQKLTSPKPREYKPAEESSTLFVEALKPAGETKESIVHYSADLEPNELVSIARGLALRSSQSEDVQSIPSLCLRSLSRSSQLCRVGPSRIRRSRECLAILG
jgi:hypothetical protein